MSVDSGSSKTARKRLPDGIRQLPNSRYQARISVTKNGKASQVSVGTFTSLAAAKDARSLALAQRQTGAYVDRAGPRTPFRLWVDEWLTLRGGTLNAPRRSFLARHILPEFGDCRLGDITPLQVQHFVRSLETKPLAPTTVNAVYRTLAQICKAAVDYDMLAKSPCRAIARPRNQGSAPTRMDAATVARVEAGMPAHLRAMAHLSAWCGMRWQECAALHWEQIDLTTGTVLVDRAVKSDTRKIGLPKNGKSRIVYLSATAVQVLTAHRRDFGGAGLLFPNARQGVLDYGSFNRRIFTPLITRLELEPAPTYHDLRHHYAFQMKQSGLDATALSVLMGHHSASFTMDTYGYERVDLGDAARAAVEGMMARQA